MAREEAMKLSLMTWNINRLKRKLPYVTHEANKYKVDIVFLQETRIGPQDTGVFGKLKEWHILFSAHDSRTKGVAILIKKNIDYKLSEETKHDAGCYIIAKCELRGQLYTLVNVYSHKSENNILDEVRKHLQKSADGLLVIGGDFNTALNPCLDRTSTTTNDKHEAWRKCVAKLTTSLHLVDVWRRMNRTKIQYTYSQNDNKSRLDYIFMQEESMWQVKTCEILDTPVKCSDHKPVCLRLTSTPSSHGPIKDTNEMTVFTDLYSYVAPILAWLLEEHFKGMTAQTEEEENKTKSRLVIHPGRREKVKWSLLEEAIEALEHPLLKSTLFYKLLRRSDQDQDCKQLQPDCLLTTALLKLYVRHHVIKILTSTFSPGKTIGALIYGEIVMISLSFHPNDSLLTIIKDELRRLDHC